MISKTAQYFLIIIFTGITGIVLAQDGDKLNQEVEVVKAYRPSVSDANKISVMPQVEDTTHEKPNFDYSIFSQPIFSAFSVNPLKAATYSSEPDEDTGFGYVRAGVGNYNRPYGELFFNSQNIRNTLFGLHGKHISSHSKLTLEGGDKVQAPFSENEAEMFLKHLYRNSVLSVNLGFDHDGFNYYGYPEDPIPNVLLTEGEDLSYLGMRQTFTKGSFNIGLENETARKNDFTFDFDFTYHYFGTKTDQREHFGEFSTSLKKPYYDGTGFLEAGITFVRADEVFNQNQMAIGKSQQTWFTAKPSYKIGGEVANLQFGLNTWFVIDSSTEMMAKIAPVVKLNFVPVKEIINIFAGLDGNYINNHYSKIAYENPFVDPGHHVKNTFERFHFFGGFDGKLAAKTNFKISVDYSVIREKPLFYLFKYEHPVGEDEIPVVENDFNVIYDNLDLLKFNLEIFHVSLEKMNMLLSGNYYVYKMQTMEEAWNLPDWDAELSLEYQVSDQLSLSSELFLTGQRTALILSVPGEDPRIPEPLTNAELLQLENLQWETYNLSAVFDLNLIANYKITNQFSVFAQLNNFGFQKYQRWLGYPVQSFNVLGGLSYSF